jgi:hypothetical protein
MRSRRVRRGSALVEELILLGLVVPLAAGLVFLGVRALVEAVRFALDVLTGPLV